MRIVVMGVTGCGKSTVGARLAESLAVTFGDADDLHPEANVAKMSRGEPLTDDDRWPWLDEVGAWLAARPDSVIACSALKRVYRDRLRAAAEGVFFIHLSAPFTAISARVEERTRATDHFAGVDLLVSQYAALEPLQGDEDGLTIDIAHAAPAQAVEYARQVVA
ncbi:gluconokinase [Demequina capsici]|uniref:Gluconokinase n=1 Tax=Demequina capsici TaxID=3075620 RepID=A0AA96JCC1_9MICO|nr:gluconokinase [Demequina sp. PMTSA13]WNM26761.1 gluconokinase [Demequina sp. PMTSA13]